MAVGRFFIMRCVNLFRKMKSYDDGLNALAMFTCWKFASTALDCGTYGASCALFWLFKDGLKKT